MHPIYYMSKPLRTVNYGQDIELFLIIVIRLDIIIFCSISLYFGRKNQLGLKLGSKMVSCHFYGNLRKTKNVEKLACKICCLNKIYISNIIA